MARDERPPWTEREREVVKQMLQDDFTCSGIGKIFRPPITRVAVLRRVVADPELWACRPKLRLPELFRYMSKKPKPPAPEKPRRLVEPLKERKAHRSPDAALIQHKADIALAGDPPLPAMRDVPVSGMRLVALIDLGRGDCKWPVQDDPGVVGGVLFCGKATKDGASYCRAHTHLSLPARAAAAAVAALPKPARNRLLDKFGGVP